MAASSSNQHHRPGFVDQRPPPAQLIPTEGKAVLKETRDWAELPLDALLDVLRRLDVVDILMGPGHVCQPWRHATQEEPDLWRHINIRRKVDKGIDLQPAARAAIRRSSSRCEAFFAKGLRMEHKDFFLFLADSAPQLKSLRLISCESILFRDDLSQGMRKFHMLEELELSLHFDHKTPSRFFNLDKTCSAAAEACPLLKRLRLNKYCFHGQSRIGDTEATEIGKMHGLQFLQLFGNSLGNDGLTTILRACVRLQSLDIRHCFNVKMSDEVRAACARLPLHTLRVPGDTVDDYDLSFGSPQMERGPAGPVIFSYVDDLEGPEPCDNPGSVWYHR